METTIAHDERNILLSNAIIWLDFLLKNNILAETNYQEFFEKNPIVFEILGYTEFYPFTKKSNQTLPRDRFSNLAPEPDFIVKNCRGLFEIFEIKTPTDKTLTISRNAYRKRFSAEMSSYLSQTMCYADYFRNPENRQTCFKLYGIDIQENVPQKIIIGLNKHIDIREIHKLCDQYKHRIDIISYDDVLKALKKEYKKHYGKYEGGVGCSIHAAVKFDSLQDHERNYFFDLAKDLDKNRISIYINKFKELNFEVLSDNGHCTVVSINTDSIDYLDKYLYFSFELGIQDDSFYISISINGNEYDYRKIKASLHLDFSNSRLSIGNSKTGKDWSNSTVGRFILYNHAITHEERNYVFNEMRYPLQGLRFNNGNQGVIDGSINLTTQNEHEPGPLIYYFAPKYRFIDTTTIVGKLF